MVSVPVVGGRTRSHSRGAASIEEEDRAARAAALGAPIVDPSTVSTVSTVSTPMASTLTSFTAGQVTCYALLQIFACVHLKKVPHIEQGTRQAGRGAEHDNTTWRGAGGGGAGGPYA
jgi:hypothetical protein